MSQRVSHAEARAILSRFNASHWNNTTEHARYSIPARPDHDDDLLLARYIDQGQADDATLERATALLKQWLDSAHHAYPSNLSAATRDFLAGQPESPTGEKATVNECSMCRGRGTYFPNGVNGRGAQCPCLLTPAKEGGVW